MKIIKNLNQREAEIEVEKVFGSDLKFPEVGVNFLWWEDKALWERYPEPKTLSYKPIGSLDLFIKEEETEDMTLHVDYQLQKLDDFIGQDSLVESLTTVITREEDIPHAFLFVGPAGCGKTTLAYIVANKIGCSEFDTHYYNAANTRGIETIREINNSMPFAPTAGKRKMYILDEVHQVTGPAQEALLEMLLHPPAHVYFTLCTTQPESLKDTFIRRTHQYVVKPLQRTQVVNLLKRVCKEEGLEDYPESVMRKIAGVCWGSPGQALKMLDQVIDMEDEEEAKKAIEEVTVSETTVKDIATTLLSKELSPKNKWAELRKLLTNFDADAEQTRRALLGYFSVVLLNTSDPQVAKMMALFTDTFMYLGKPGLVLACYYASGAERDNDDIPF